MNYLQKTIDLVGGQSQLAKKITRWHSMNGAGLIVRQQYVWKWLNSNLPMPPAEHCRAIEEITNGTVTRYDLRPDVFGTLPCSESNQIKEAA